MSRSRGCLCHSVPLGVLLQLRWKVQEGLSDMFGALVLTVAKMPQSSPDSLSLWLRSLGSLPGGQHASSTAEVEAIAS